MLSALVLRAVPGSDVEKLMVNDGGLMSRLMVNGEWLLMVNRC